MNLLLVFFTLLILIPSHISGKTGPEVNSESDNLISKVISAYGGAEVIEGTKAVYARGKIKAMVRNDEGIYTRHFMRDRKLRVEIKYSHSRETRILNGRRGWRGTAREPLKEVQGHRLISMIYQYKQLDIVYGLLMNKYKIQHTANKRLGKKRFVVLELMDEEGPLIEIFIDLDNYLIIYIAGHFKINNNVVALSVVLGDFRMVEGVPMPYKITNFAGEIKTGENVIEEYVINPEMEQTLFKIKENHLL